MSGQQISLDPETLFSFELLVEYIQVEKHCKVSDELALGVRLLDFPTLLIYQSQQRRSNGRNGNQSEYSGKDKPGVYTFNRGKCCFFKMSLNLLHVHLTNTPLYAMVLDVKEETPKLVGSSLISLAKAMDTIRQDVAERGVSSPSSHRERGLVAAVSNLLGEKIGTISLSYKLLCLGASLLPHITGRERAPGGKQAQEHVKETNKSAEPLTVDSGNACSVTLECSRGAQNKGEANVKILLSEDEKEDDEQRPQRQIEHDFEEDLTVFCPPHLYYSAEEKGTNGQGNYKSWSLDLEAPMFEDLCSKEEVDDKEVEGPSSPVMQTKVRHDAEISNQEGSRRTPNVLREALQQMPLLNALLVELSQLNGNQSLSVHPSLAWIYRPISAEASAGNTPLNVQTKSLKKTKQETLPLLRNCSTPIIKSVSVKQEEMLNKSKSSGKSTRMKLVYGTTKTFNLRLKQSSPLKVNHRECMDLKQNKTQSDMAKEKARLSHKTIKSGKRKSVLKQRPDLNETIETVIQSISQDSALKETVTPKHKNLYGKAEGKQCRNFQRTSEKSSLSERDLKCIHIPRVDSDSVPQSKDKSEHHSESDQSQPEADRHGNKIESSRSSRHSSQKSSFSDSSRDGDEEADYVDDFNSLEPSDAYSPDLVSSPEPSRAKTPKSPAHTNFGNSDSGSDSIQRKEALFPVPIKAPSSPQHALRGTYIIHQTQTSALSFSSDECDEDKSTSPQRICSKKQMSASTRVEMTSGAESFISSRGERSVSARNSIPVRGLSAESISFFEPQEVEELEDELGSLDFRKEYQHVSELVANKLPGYTM